MQQTEKSIQNAINDLKGAQQQYDEAHKASSAAGIQETEALNRLNKAQKNFDEAVNEIKSDAPPRSDWRESNRRKNDLPTD